MATAPARSGLRSIPSEDVLSGGAGASAIAGVAGVGTVAVLTTGERSSRGAAAYPRVVLAETTATLVLLLWAIGQRYPLPRPARIALHALLAAAALQFALGVATLLFVVPIPLAAAHQAGAVLLLTGAILLRHTLRAGPVQCP